MKKGISLLIIIIIVFAFTFVSFSDTHDLYYDQDYVFALPSSLLKIEDEAFAGTAAKTVIIQSGLLHIGDYSFFAMPNLIDVHIPGSTLSIGKFAFPESEYMTIYSTNGSVAEEWARTHDVSFVSINLGSTALSILIIVCFPIELYFKKLRLHGLIGFHGRTINEGKSMRPQDRIELYPIDYKFP